MAGKPIEPCRINSVEPESNLPRALGRVSGRMLRRNRIVNAGIEAGKTTAVAAGKAARRLWLEVTGFVFGVFAVIGAGATIREWTGGADRTRIWTGVAFTLMFAYFCASSFLASRRSR
jgi:hypothetical protein